MTDYCQHFTRKYCARVSYDVCANFDKNTFSTISIIRIFIIRISEQGRKEISFVMQVKEKEFVFRNHVQERFKRKPCPLFFSIQSLVLPLKSYISLQFNSQREILNDGKINRRLDIYIFFFIEQK